MLPKLIASRRKLKEDVAVFFVDHYFENQNSIIDQLPIESQDIVIFVDSNQEPTTCGIDQYDRDKFLDYMKNNEIDCRQMINPVHHSDHFKPQFENNEFLNSVNISKQSAHLPSGLKLTENHISKVANKIVEYFLSIE